MPTTRWVFDRFMDDGVFNLLNVRIYSRFMAFLYLSSPSIVVLMIMDGLPDDVPTALEYASGTIAFTVNIATFGSAVES